MRVLIVAKIRRGTGACVEGITQQGQSIRLMAVDAAYNEHAGLEYNVGEVWEVEADPDPDIIPPHVENVIVHSARCLKRADNVEKIIQRFMPPTTGGPNPLFEEKLQCLPSGALFVAERSGLPGYSTMVWTPDQPLSMEGEDTTIRYRYPTPDGGRLLTFVGFQEPLEVIPAGTLLHVSLAPWWRPADKPEEEVRCHLQLSGWFPHQLTSAASSPASRVPHQAPDGDRARQVLKQTFGFAEFHPLQEEIVQRLMTRQDTMVIMPTGGGKSLCYQLPALLHDGLTVVVSPLIALMQDQVSQLRELDVSTGFLNSTLLRHDYAAVTQRVREGALRILYVAPETLLRPDTLALLDQSRVSCIAVDEAHCISEWGHDFRPEYRQIRQVRERFSEAVCVALTATATQRVREDIRDLLGLPGDGEFIASFDRPNLLLSVRSRRDGLGQTLELLEQHRGHAGIIYCSSRKQVDQLAGELSARGWSALPYHAGMPTEDRRRNQDTFIRDDATIIVATIAFGMGINKSNVRFVLHYNLPKDVESYYQEIGRAGRDGLPAECLLLYSRADAMTIRRFIEEGAASERAGRQARLDALIRYAEARGCRRSPLMAYFGEHYEGACDCCDNCCNDESPGEQVEVTEAAQKFLSCVVRTGEVFGAAHVIDVLRGSKSQRVIDRRHDQLSTYGIGMDRSKEQWRDLVQQLIEQGLVEQDLQFGGLRLTASSHPVLKGEKVFVRQQPDRPARVKARAAAVEHDSELFEQLRQLRRELAAQAGLPTYIIFSDRALIEMAAHLPRTPEQFLGINGVGEAKLAHYGDAFLNAIRDYTEANPSASAAAPAPVAASDPTQWKTVRRRHEEVGEAFAAGESIAKLSERLGIKSATVVQHLQRFVESGGKVDAAKLLEPIQLESAKLDPVVAAFEKHGLERLGPVHEALGASVSYDELHLVRLWLRTRGSEDSA